MISAEASFDPPKAVVVHDPDKVSLDDLTAALTNVGYPSEVREKQD